MDKPTRKQRARTAGYKPLDLHWNHFNDDLPILDWVTIQKMLRDPTVKLGLAMRRAPIQNCQFAYKETGSDEWTEGVKASHPKVAAYVLRQLKKIWQNLEGLLMAQEYGWAACEVIVGPTQSGGVEIAELLHRHANDVRAILFGGQIGAVRFMRIEGNVNGYVDLPVGTNCPWLGPPRAIFHAFSPLPGCDYGQPILLGAQSPWMDKCGPGGALKVRRLTMQQNSINGAKMYYPSGTMQIPGFERPVPNRDIARQIVEQKMAGAVVTLPSDTHDGKRKWELEDAAAMSGLDSILQYPKDCDIEILRGMEIPDDVIMSQADSSGAWAGKQVPQAAFYTGLTSWAMSLLRDIKRSVLDYLVEINFGPGHWFELGVKPLAEQAMEEQKKPQDSQNAAPPQQPGMQQPNPFGQDSQRMSLNAVEAVGQGVISASELVNAAKRVIRMEAGRAPKGGVTINGEEFKGGEFIPGMSQAEVDKAASKEPKKPKAKPDKGDAASERAAKAEQKFAELMKTKTPADAKAFTAARRDGVAIPPAWTEVVYHGADKNIIAEGRDDKGRKQRAENPAYRQGLSDQNNARISKELTPRISKIRSQLRKDALAGNEEAKVLYLISITGFRIGGKGDGKAKEQAFGASTLMGEHVKIDGDTVTFDFKGKKGVRQNHTVNDKVVADMLRNAKPGQPLFNTRDTKVRAAWQQTYGGEKVHDIRHVVATEIATRELAKRVPPPPKNEKEKKAIIKEVAAIAANTLGNNPAQTLETYIDPQIWRSTQVAA